MFSISQESDLPTLLIILVKTGRQHTQSINQSRLEQRINIHLINIFFYIQIILFQEITQIVIKIYNHMPAFNFHPSSSTYVILIIFIKVFLNVFLVFRCFSAQFSVFMCFSAEVSLKCLKTFT